jgi:predicted membrane metal-binding protein
MPVVYWAVLRLLWRYLTALIAMLAACLAVAVVVLWLLPESWRTTPAVLVIAVVLYAGFKAFAPELERQFQDRFQWQRSGEARKGRGESPPRGYLGRGVDQRPPDEPQE